MANTFTPHMTEECKYLLEVGKRYIDRALKTRTDRSIEVAPGVFTGEDYSYFLPLLAEACHELQQAFSVGVDRLTRYNFDDVLQLAGYPMKPMGAPAPLERKGNFDEECVEMYKYIVEDYTSEFQYGLALHISKVSSSGPPFWSHDLKYKSQLLRDWIENMDDICLTFKHEGYLGLLKRENPITNTFGINYRAQTDKIKAEYDKQGHLIKVESKLRAVEDWLGRATTASKELGSKFCRFVKRVRMRLVWAMSGTVNYAFGALMQGFRYPALNKTMAAILHHPDVKQTILSLKGCLKVASWDITRFDHAIRRIFQLVWVQRFRNLGIREELCQIMEDATGCPAIFPCDYPGEEGFNVCSYPLASDVRTLDDFGLPSGIWWVADVGKTMGVLIVMWALYKEGVLGDFRVKENRMKLYRNEFSWYLIYKGSGDDTIAGENTPGAIQKVIDHASEIGFELSEDEEAGFLGQSLVQENGSFEVRPNLASGLTKFWVPERRISRGLDDHTPRKYWAYGIPLRNQYYGDHPLWDIVWEKSLDVAESYFKKDIRGRILKAQKEQEKALSNVIELDNVYDRMFIENQDYIHYRINPQDVSPSLLAKEFLVIPPEDTDRLVAAMGLRQVA